LSQGDGGRQRFAGFYCYGGIFWVLGVYGDYRGGANGGFFFAGFVDDQLGAGGHFAEVFYGGGGGDAVPEGGFVALEIGEGVDGGFGFQKVGHRWGLAIKYRTGGGGISKRGTREAGMEIGGTKRNRKKRKERGIAAKSRDAEEYIAAQADLFAGSERERKERRPIPLRMTGGA